MADMKFKYTIQPFQTDAVESVADVFQGQPYSDVLTYRRDMGVSAPAPAQMALALEDEIDLSIGYANGAMRLSSDQLLENVQKIQTRNNIPLTENLREGAVGACSLDVEMETGTGKTYVYIKTMFELNRRYGWTKFVVVVPSIAIREGVRKSFESMREHFKEYYGKIVQSFIYDSGNLQKIDDFSTSADIYAMIINIQAFNRDFSEDKKGNAIINTSTNALVVGCKNTVILNSVTSIGNYAFSYCTGLTSIEIPNSVTSIGNYAFSGCTGLTSIAIPNSVISIEVWTFAGCTSLTSIEIPNSVTSIGGYAFYNCGSLESVIMLSQSVPSLGNSTFPSTNANFFIYVPYASLNDYKTATNWSNYEPRILPMVYATVPGYGVGNDKWVFIASPLSEDVIPTTIDNMLLGTNYDLYQFDQSATDEEWQNYKVDSFNLVNGQGYVYANEVEVNIIFKGVFNEDETKVVNLDYDAEKANPGWNLVGNPFPVDAYIDRPYYVMNEDGTAINPIAVPASTPIPPCVGVLVKADGTGESVTFSRSAPDTQK